MTDILFIVHRSCGPIQWVLCHQAAPCQAPALGLLVLPDDAAPDDFEQIVPEQTGILTDVRTVRLRIRWFHEQQQVHMPTIQHPRAYGENRHCDLLDASTLPRSRRKNTVIRGSVGRRFTGRFLIV
jgi:hypothetical protein